MAGAAHPGALQRGAEGEILWVDPGPERLDVLGGAGEGLLDPGPDPGSQLLDVFVLGPERRIAVEPGGGFPCYFHVVDPLVVAELRGQGTGFQLAQPTRPLGPSPRAFGHYGYGGSLGFADPDAGVAFCYLMNRPGERWQTPRTQRLVDALYDCL